MLYSKFCTKEILMIILNLSEVKINNLSDFVENKFDLVLSNNWFLRDT